MLLRSPEEQTWLRDHKAIPLVGIWEDDLMIMQWTAITKET
jgi:hypothetical protein